MCGCVWLCDCGVYEWRSVYSTVLCCAVLCDVPVAVCAADRFLICESFCTIGTADCAGAACQLSVGGGAEAPANASVYAPTAMSGDCRGAGGGGGGGTAGGKGGSSSSSSSSSGGGGVLSVDNTAIFSNTQPSFAFDTNNHGVM